MIRSIALAAIMAAPPAAAGMWPVIPSANLGQARCSDLPPLSATPVSITTADNIQTAIGTACGAGPGVVELAAGTYTDRNTRLGTGGQAIGGECIIRAANPAAKPLIRATLGTNLAIFQAENVNHRLRFQNLRLDGRRGSQTSGSVTACPDTAPADGFCDSSQNLTNAHGIWSRDTASSTAGSVCVLGVEIIDVVGDGVNIRDDSNSAVESTTVAGAGCDPTTCPSLNVPEDLQTNTITVASRGVNFVDSTKLMVVDGTFTGVTKQGAQCFDSYQCYILQNSITGAGLAGITMLGSDGVVAGNTVTDTGFGWAPNTTADNSGIGIQAVDGLAGYNFNVKFVGNTVSHSRHDGIQIGLTPTNSGSPVAEAKNNTIANPCDGSTNTVNGGLALGDDTKAYPSIVSTGNTITGSKCFAALRVQKPTAYTGTNTTISGTVSGKGIIYDDAAITESAVVTDKDIDIDLGTSGTLTGCTLNGGAVVTDASAGAVTRTGGCIAGSSFVTLAGSAEWGTGGSIVNLTGVIPPFRTHEEAQGSQPALPLDTTGWPNTVTLSACTEAALETALAAAISDETVVDMTACTEIVVSSATGNIFLNWSPAANKIVLRGHANRTVIRRSNAGVLPTSSDGYNEQIMQIGSGSDPSFTGNSFALTRGATMGSQVIGSADVITGVDEGDILWIGSPSGFRLTGGDHDTVGSGATYEFRQVRRVLCRRIGGTNVGSDCTGVSVNGDIRLDKPLTMDFTSTGPYHYSSQFTGFTIRNATDAGVKRYIGVENVEFTHSHPLAIDPDRPLLRWQGVNYFWMKNVVFNGASASQLDFGGSTTHTGPGLLQSVRFNNEVWDTTCSVAVLSLATTNPVQLTMNSPAACTWGAVGEPIWFPDDFPISAIRGTHAYTITTPESGGQITIALTGIDGAGMSTNPGGWGVSLEYFSNATVYMRTGTSGVEFADLTMDNTRIGILMQGAMETIIGYADLWTDAQIGYNRGVFDHDGWGSFLIEGVRSNAQWLTLQATSPAAGPGEGPHQIVYQSHFLSDGTSTTSAYGAASSGNRDPGELQNEDYSGRVLVQNYGQVLFGNVIGQAAGTLDDCDAEGTAAGCTDDNAAGVHRLDGFHLTGDLWPSYNIDANLAPYSGATENTTSVTPEAEAGDANEAAELSVGDRARSYPTSLYRTVVPSWWCTQSGEFPGIGAKYRDAETSPHPNLPARIRRLGTTCTPP